MAAPPTDGPDETTATARSLSPMTVVGNPVSGGGRGGGMAEQVTARLCAAGADVRLAWTQRPGDAQRLAQEALGAGARCVVACGGDGTIQQVARALAHTGAVMGLAPSGRCNDFARALGVRADAEAIARALTGGVVRPVDLGRVRGPGPDGRPAPDRFYCTIAAAGFDAQVSRFVDRSRMPLKGTPAYLYGVMRVLQHYRCVPVRMRGDFGRFDGRIFLAAVANTAAYGGAIYIAPDARPDDGLLDVCLIRESRRIRVLRMLPRTLSGSHGTAKEVRFLRTRALHIESPQDLEIWADGEPIARTPATLEAVPGALRVALPRAPVSR